MVKKVERVKLATARQEVERVLMDAHVRPDLILNRAGRDVLVEFKGRVGAAEAFELLRSAPTAPHHLIVLADTTTASARDILARHGVGVADAHGNVRIEFPQAYVLRDSTRKSAQPRRPARLAGKAALIAQALLLDRDRHWQLRELANTANVSTALAHRVTTRLEEHGLVRVEGRGPKRVRVVVDPSAILELLAEELDDRGVRRTKVHRLARSAKDLLGSTSTELDSAGIRHAVTGAAAGHLIAPLITSVPVVDVWVEYGRSASEVAAILGREVSEGHNLLIQRYRDDSPLAFRERHSDVWLANPVRLYVDLRRAPMRGREQAEHLRKAVLGF